MTEAAKKRLARIRDALRQNSDGLTKRQIQTLVPGWSVDTIEADLLSMPDAYIDRWQPARQSRHKYVAVWCVVIPPPNCPKPCKKN